MVALVLGRLHRYIMFSDRDAVSGAEFPSCWKMELSLTESGCQTMPSTTAEISCQVGERVDTECQAEEGELHDQLVQNMFIDLYLQL